MSGCPYSNDPAFCDGGTTALCGRCKSECLRATQGMGTGTGSIGDESPVAKGDAPNLHRRRVIDE